MSQKKTKENKTQMFAPWYLARNFHTKKMKILYQRPAQPQEGFPVFRRKRLLFSRTEPSRISGARPLASRFVTEYALISPSWAWHP